MPDKADQINKIKELILELSKGNLSSRGETNSSDPQLNELMAATNMFAGILEETTVSKNLLEKSESKFRSLTENAPLSIIEINKDAEVLYTNKSVEYGIDFPITDQCLLEFYPAKDHDMIKAKIGEAFAENKNTSYITTFHDNEKGKRWYSCKVSALSNAGITQTAIVISEDITEKILIEQELQDAKKIAELGLKAKNSFLATMSHEIRTPMNAILGFTDLLNSTALRAEEQSFVDAIREAGENLLRLINDILDFSKIEAGMIDLEKEPFDPKKLIYKIKTLLEHRAKDKGLAFEIKIADQLPEFVSGDSLRLNQILVNLVNNAIKFTTKGSVTIKVEVPQRTDKEVTLKFSVIDTGIGIPEKEKKNLFEAYTQANSSISRSHGGTGLGLNIVKNLVELQDGKMNPVVSEKGVGTEMGFQLTYPISQTVKKDSVSSDIEKSGIDPQNYHILLVEDNVLNQNLAGYVLGGFGFQFSIADDGHQAIDKMKNNAYDVILMDVQMPGMDGYEATRIIRDELKSKIPIIAMTAHSMAGQREKCISKGMNDYISKPYKPRDLFKVISAYLPGKISHEPKAEPDVIQTENKSEGEYQFLDLNYLNKLSGGNTEFELEMINLFLDVIPNKVAYLKTAIEKRNHKKIRIEAHSMRNNFSTVGAQKSPGLLKKIELMAESGGDIERIGQMAEKIYEEWDGLERELTLEMSKRSA